MYFFEENRNPNENNPEKNFIIHFEKNVQRILEVKKLNANNTRLTSSEMTNLFTQFQQETMSICICKHVLATAKDVQVRSLYKLSLDLSEKHAKRLKEFFKKENCPVPDGLTDKDVNLNAPPLFTDSFWLDYLFAVIHFGLSGLSLSFSVSARRDIRDYYYQCNIEAMDLYNKIMDVLLSKGDYEPHPYFLTPKKVQYITNLNYTLDVLGKKRPLNTSEAGNIYFNLKMTCMAKGISLGFYQVTKNDEVRKYLEKALKTANKNYDIFSSLLRENNLYVPQLLDTEVTDSTVSPFSDKLMMLKSGFLVGAAISYYGTAIVASLRVDLVGHCEAAILRMFKLMPTWENIVVKNGWLEKLPEANDRIQLPNR